MSVANVRSALGTALRTISALHADEYVVTSVRPPHAMVDFRMDYDLTFARGGHGYTFYVMVYDQLQQPEQSQRRLDQLRDPEAAAGTGIKQTLEGDATLAAQVDYIRVVNDGGPIVPVTIGNADYLRLTFECEVVL